LVRRRFWAIDPGRALAEDPDHRLQVILARGPYRNLWIQSNGFQWLAQVQLGENTVKSIGLLIGIPAAVEALFVCESQAGKIAVAGANTCDRLRDLREGYELPFEWNYVVLPDGGAGYRCWGDTDQIVITPTSENPDEAFAWMLYRSSREAWEQAYEGGIILAYSDGPTRYSIFESKAYQEPLGMIDIKMIEEGYGYTIPNPYVPRTPDPYRILFTIIPTEVDNVLRGAKSAEQAAADMCGLVEEVLATATASSFMADPQCGCAGT
jgi:ABC-type glycerol-3-phosphate transport system substrate-binding protein